MSNAQNRPRRITRERVGEIAQAFERTDRRAGATENEHVCVLRLRRLPKNLLGLVHVWRQRRGSERLQSSPKAAWSPARARARSSFSAKDCGWAQGRN